MDIEKLVEECDALILNCSGDTRMMARAVIRSTLEWVGAGERLMAAPYANRNDLFDRGAYAARMQCADWCASMARSLASTMENDRG